MTAEVGLVVIAEYGSMPKQISVPSAIVLAFVGGAGQKGFEPVRNVYETIALLRRMTETLTTDKPILVSRTTEKTVMMVLPEVLKMHPRLPFLFLESEWTHRPGQNSIGSEIQRKNPKPCSSTFPNRRCC